MRSKADQEQPPKRKQEQVYLCLRDMSPAVSAIFRKPPATTQICMWQNQGMRKAPVCLVRLALCSSKAHAKLEWVITVHWSLSIIFSCCHSWRNRYPKTASASANITVQQEQTFLLRALYFRWFTSDELYPGPASWALAAGVWQEHTWSQWCAFGPCRGI